MSRSIDKEIDNLDFYLEKLKFIQLKYPDTQFNSHTSKRNIKFISKKINESYTNFDFIHSYNSLYIEPHILLTFNYNNREEIIKIYSSPMKNRLAYAQWDYSTKPGKTVLKFSKIALNLKNRNFREGLLVSCQMEIMKFIKKNPSIELDTTHLDSRLKKLIIFT